MALKRQLVDSSIEKSTSTYICRIKVTPANEVITSLDKIDEVVTSSEKIDEVITSTNKSCRSCF